MLRTVYTCIISLLVPVATVRLLWQGTRYRRYLSRIGERFGLVPREETADMIIHVHAVSVGEVNAVTPLLMAFRARYPQARLLVTTVTASGASAIAQRNIPGTCHRFFPFDVPWSVKAFLDRVHPALVVIVETEIWPNFYFECGRRGIPLGIVNARISPRSFRGYKRVRRLFSETMRHVSVVLAQGTADAERFMDLGAQANRIRTYGNLKFDIDTPHSVVETGQAIRRRHLGQGPVWIAASTHEGEESILIDAQLQIEARLPGCRLILAPRHPERVDRVLQILSERGLRGIRRSEADRGGDPGDVLVVDTLGELAVFFAASDVAFVGGSLVAKGGHNVLEPAALGMPVVSGPWVHNFSDIVDQLAVAGAIRICRDREQLAEVIYDYLTDANLRFSTGQSARQVCEQNRGATGRTVAALERLLQGAV